jgi:hypothetical protein
VPGNPIKRARREAEADRNATQAPASPPAPAPARPRPLSGSVVRQDWQATFLRTFADTGNIRVSLEQCAREGVKVSRGTLDSERRRNDDFSELYEHAKKQAVDVLEAEARRRAMSGSDTLLITLLKAHAPEKYVERYQLEHAARGIGSGSVVEIPDDSERNQKVIEALEASGYIVAKED